MCVSVNWNVGAGGRNGGTAVLGSRSDVQGLWSHGTFPLLTDRHDWKHRWRAVIKPGSHEILPVTDIPIGIKRISMYVGPLPIKPDKQTETGEVWTIPFVAMQPKRTLWPWVCFSLRANRPNCNENIFIVRKRWHGTWVPYPTTINPATNIWWSSLKTRSNLFI